MPLSHGLTQFLTPFLGSWQTLVGMNAWFCNVNTKLRGYLHVRPTFSMQLTEPIYKRLPFTAPLTARFDDPAN